MGDRQTLADAIEHGPDLNVRPNGQYEQRIFEDGWDLALDRVKSGEVVSPEMQALAKINPCRQSPISGSVMNVRWVCELCRIEKVSALRPFATEHAEDCLWRRARAITKGETDE